MKNTINELLLPYRSIKSQNKLIRMRVCKTSIGSSIIRVFEKGSKEKLLKALMNVDIDILPKVNSRAAYNSWHLKQVHRIYLSLSNHKNIKRHTVNGLKWGHSTKILNIYVGLILFYSQYFQNNSQILKLKNHIHVPLDSQVFNKLREGNVENVPRTIKSIDKKEYYRLQDILFTAMTTNGFSPYFFDEIAWVAS